MNERIRELALQAGAGEWGDSIVPAMMDVEKFAELLIRECQDNLSWHGHDEAVSQLDWLKVNRFGLKR